MGNVIYSDGCHKWVVVFGYNVMTRFLMSKFMMIFSSIIGIPLNEINNNSVAVSTENFTEATEVSYIDTYSLEVV